MKVLQVIDQAFRTTTEEQDDTVLWLTQSMRGAGGDLRVLLTGHGSYYATQSKRQPVLRIAGWKQTEPATLTRDLANLMESGVPVYTVAEDLAERGLPETAVYSGIEVISRKQIVDLYESVDQVWQW